MSLINTISLLHYTALANSSAYSMIKINNTRMSILNDTAGGIGNIPLERLAELDNQLELALITNSLQYKMAKAMTEQLKKQQKEDAKKFSTFA